MIANANCNAAKDLVSLFANGERVTALRLHGALDGMRAVAFDLEDKRLAHLPMRVDTQTGMTRVEQHPFGHDVLVAHDGQAGLELARHGRPDVVLCDIGLPGLDGFGVAAALRRAPPDPMPYLVALTGYGRQEDVTRARQAGFDRHFTKPIDLDELRRLLAELSARRAAGQA